MTTSQDVACAIAHVRHVIQEHAPVHFKLGAPARLDDVRWLAKLLGWDLPDAYLRTIEIHDGVFAGFDMVLSSDRAFKTLRIFRNEWHRPDGYWPVGADGCGSYWAMNICRQGAIPPGSVLFYDHERDADPDVLSNVFAATYPAFVSAMMQRSCNAADCDWKMASDR